MIVMGGQGDIIVIIIIVVVVDAGPRALLAPYAVAKGLAAHGAGASRAAEPPGRCTYVEVR